MQQAEQLVSNFFPKKIAEMDNILKVWISEYIINRDQKQSKAESWSYCLALMLCVFTFILLYFLGITEPEGSVCHQGYFGYSNPRPCQRGAQEKEERGGQHDILLLLKKWMIHIDIFVDDIMPGFYIVS